MTTSTNAATPTQQVPTITLDDLTSAAEQFAPLLNAHHRERPGALLGPGITERVERIFHRYGVTFTDMNHT